MGAHDGLINNGLSHSEVSNDTGCIPNGESSFWSASIMADTAAHRGRNRPQRAGRLGRELAESLGIAFSADIRLVHVLDVETQPGELGELVRDGEQFVADYPAADPAKGARIDRVFRMGQPAEEIVAAANDWSANLIVLGTHARKGLDRLMLGSTAEGVLRRARCPVLCVGHDLPEPVQISRILVAVDESNQAAWAAAVASRFASAMGPRVALAHVAPFAVPVEPGYGMVVDRADEVLRTTGEKFLASFPWPQCEPPPERLVRQGPTVQEILAASRVECRSDRPWYPRPARPPPASAWQHRRSSIAPCSV